MTVETPTTPAAGTLEITSTSSVVIVGHKGSGKTTLCKRLIRGWKRQLTYIYDPLDEYDEITPAAYYDIDSVIDAFERGEKAVRYVRGCIGDAADLLEYIREIDDILVVQDEADQILNAGRNCNPEAFLWINDYGRHCKMGLISLARRPSSLPRDLTAQSVFCFKPALEPRDAAYIRGRLGYDPPALPDKWDWYAHDADGGLHTIKGAWIRG